MGACHSNAKFGAITLLKPSYYSVKHNTGMTTRKEKRQQNGRDKVLDKSKQCAEILFVMIQFNYNHQNSTFQK